MIDKIIESLKFENERATKRITKFTDRIAEGDAAYAFAWGDDAAQAAADIKINELATKRLEAEPDLDQLRDWLRRNLLNDAASTSSSTSVMSNLMKRNELAAMASLLRTLGEKS